MKVVVAYTIGALLVATLGGVFLKSSRVDRSIADAQHQLVAANYAAVEPVFEDAEGWFTTTSRIPGVGQRALADMQARRAALSYRQGRYGDIVPQGAQPVSTLPVDNLDLQIVVANAVYRSGRQRWTDLDSALAALDEGITAYLTVLRNEPDNDTAAYNYEYLLRLRRELEEGERQPDEVAEEGDGWLGREGGPPQERDESIEFKIYIPLQSEELDQEEGGGAGKDQPRQRRG